MGQLKNLSTTVRLTVANLSSENKSAFGPGIAKLCLGVREMGSLNAAAKGMRMAYSKAWKIVKIAEENLGFPLLVSVTGGKGGGGAELTQDGKDFLAAFRRFEEAVRSYADEAFVEIMGG